MPQLSTRMVDTWENPFQLTEYFLPSILLGFLVESLLYGIHVILFLICTDILVRQRRRKPQMAMLGAAVVMFILATVDMGFSWNIILRHTPSLYTGDSTSLLCRIYPKFLFFIANNLIADILLLLRCYVVWNHNKVILISSSIVLVVGTVLGFLGEATESIPLKKYVGVYIVMVISFNIILTFLTAGRIYWTARKIKSIVGREMTSRYHFSVAIVVESGLLYTLTNILLLSLSPTRYIGMAAAFTIRTVCIMPLLIIVQITLGQSMNLKDTRKTASAQQKTGPMVFEAIATSDQYDAEGQLNIPVIESAKDELQVPLADESANADIIHNHGCFNN